MEVARPEAAEAGTRAPAAPQWVVFVCSGKCLAAPLDRIHEILTPRPFTRLPGAGPGIVGLIAVRSRIVTAYDLGVLLGLGSAAAVADHRILLVEQGGRRTGLIVDEVLAVAALDAEEEAGGGGAEEVRRWEGRPVRLLDLERVMESAPGDRRL